MKVAVHTDQLYSEASGGIGTYIRELVPALTRVDPSLALSLFHARFGRQVPEPWMKAYDDVEVPGSIRTLYPQWNLLSRPQLPGELASASVIHAPLPSAVPPVYGGQKLVVTVHDLAFQHYPKMFPAKWRWLFRAGLRASVKRADAIIVPSRSTADDILTRTSVDPRRLYVIPEAASLPISDANPDDVIERLGISSPYILSVGTIEPRKNLVRLVRAYRWLASKGLPHTLVLAGPMGWQPAQLIGEISQGGPGKIILTGRLSASDLDIVYRAAWAFAYVSLYEGFGLPILEAMSRGLPVVCSNTSSLPEVAGDGALQVDPRSVREMVTALESILRDDHLAAQLAAAGMEQSRRFSWDATARQTLEVYERA